MSAVVKVAVRAVEDGAGGGIVGVTFAQCLPNVFDLLLWEGGV